MWSNRVMRIIGHGLDLVETERVERLLADHGERFLDRCFTADEQAYANKNSTRRLEHLAGRFAAKEAILKVLGTGWSGGIKWTDAEVVRELSGQPTVAIELIEATLGFGKQTSVVHGHGGLVGKRLCQRYCSLGEVTTAAAIP